MNQAQKKEHVAHEIARLPVGTRVRVFGAPGLGFGVVKEIITEHVTGSAKNRVAVPLVGWVQVFVEFEDDGPGGFFPSTDLMLVSGKISPKRA